MLSYYRQNANPLIMLGLKKTRVNALTTVPVPTLAITGVEDGCMDTRLYDFAFVDEDFPNGIRVERVQNSGHFAPPELRANGGISWTNDKHSLSAIVRHIGSYEDDEGLREETRIDSFTTVDLQYLISLGEDPEKATTVTVGLINALDQNVPGVETNRGFDTKVHDPRGRLAYVRFKKAF